MSTDTTFSPAPSEPPASFRPDHVGIIATYGVRFALRSGSGLVFLLVVLVAGLGVAATFISPVEAYLNTPQAKQTGESRQALTKKLLENENIRTMLEGAVGWVTGADKAQSRYLIRGEPALLSAVFLILLLLYPAVICFGAFNQTAGDIGSRGLRYVLLRTERENVFLGRFAGAVAFDTVCTALLFVLIALYVEFKVGIYSGGSIWLWSGEGFLALLFLSLPYTALCAWISSLLDSAFASLSICLLVALFPVGLLWGLILVIRSWGTHNPVWLLKLLPWGWKYDLLSHDVVTRLIAFGLMLAFTALFLVLGLITFRRRDL